MCRCTAAELRRPMSASGAGNLAPPKKSDPGGHSAFFVILGAGDSRANGLPPKKAEGKCADASARKKAGTCGGGGGLCSSARGCAGVGAFTGTQWLRIRTPLFHRIA